MWVRVSEVNRVIPVAKPHIPKTKKALTLINEAFNRAYLTNFGPIERNLSEAIAEFIGVKKVVLVNNATFGLEMAIATATNEKREKQIFTTPYSFLATSTAIARNGNPIKFIDIKTESLLANFSHEDLRDVVCVDTHVYGSPSSLLHINKSKNQQNIFDAAHCFDVFINGKHITNTEDISVISCHATKLFHSVEGGIIVSKNFDLLEEIKDRSSFGKDNVDVKIAGNGKMSEIHAAIGLANLSEINEIIENRTELKELYNTILTGFGFESVKVVKARSLNYYPLLFKTRYQGDLFQTEMRNKGVEVRKYFDLSLNKKFSNQTCENSEILAGKIICLPMSSSFTSDEIKHIHKSLTDVLTHIKDEL